MKIDELRNICQGEKLKRNTGLTLLNRRISIRFSHLFIRLGITANQASVACILFGIAGSLLFVPGMWGLNLLGVALLYLSFTCDQVDGELARYYGTVNLSGVYLDEIRHLLIYSVTIFCLSFQASRELDAAWPFMMGFFGALTLVVSRVETALSYQIFTSKIILNDNFTGGAFPDASEAAPGDGAPQENEAAAGESSLRRRLGRAVYGLYHYLANQVTILIWLLGATLIDRCLLRGAGGAWGLSLQSCIFLLFCMVGPVLLFRTIRGNFLENRTEADCRRIGLRLRGETPRAAEGEGAGQFRARGV